MDERPTISQLARPAGGDKGGVPQPGLILVFAGGQPAMASLTLTEAPLLLGRGFMARVAEDDLAMSRRHAEVRRDKARLFVRDLDSRNGTWVDGARIQGEREITGARCLRVGGAIFVPSEDCRPLWQATVIVESDGTVVGPRLRETWDTIAREAQAGQLHIRGDTGTGKELAARHFHRASARARGPFVAVNCAAVPSALAERLFFGARKGAYSDAADAEGYLQAAHGGTLFLDEIAELPLELQAKLLRVVETREVVPLGATKPVPVDLGLVSATHHDLRERVAAGAFRADLFHRIGEPHVELLPLDERLEEVPWLVAGIVRGVDPELTVDVSLVEALLCRAWPGNVRELAAVVAAASRSVRAAGRTAVEGGDLGRAASAARSTSLGTPAARRADPGRAAIEEALRLHNGNIAAAARHLSTHRTQLRRWMQRHGIGGGEDGSE
jgi:transcriptional regulator of acetoin/glycerol metabolism